MIRVFLRIEGFKDGSRHPFQGAGTYGNGATLEEARKVARKYLRESFGPNIQASERHEVIPDPEDRVVALSLRPDDAPSQAELSALLVDTVRNLKVRGMDLPTIIDRASAAYATTTRGQLPAAEPEKEKKP